MTPGLLRILAAVCYLAASVLYGAFLLRSQQKRTDIWLSAGRITGAIGVVLHAAAIGLHCARTHHTPFTTPSDAFSATGWTIATVYLGLETVTWRNPPSAVGAFAYPLAFLALFCGSLVQLHHASTPHDLLLLDSSLVSLHVIAILFAFGLMALAVCCALLYLFEHRLLKTKRDAGKFFSRLPPLTAVDNLAFTLVSLAFPLLTIGLLAGILRATASATPARIWAADAQSLASFISWAFYGAYLFAHAGSSWRGVRANYLLLAGLAAALITYFAPSTLHRFS